MVRMRSSLQTTVGARRMPQRQPGIEARWYSIAVVSIALALGSCSSGEPPGGASSKNLRLMTAQQYTNSLATVFGEDIADSVPAPLPPTPRTDGLLSSGASSVGVNSDQLGQLQQAAVAVAAQVIDAEHREYLVNCTPADAKKRDDTCAESFLQKTGRLLYRRPLEPALLKQLTADAGEAADQLEDFYAGLAIALEGMLVSYEFLFIGDETEPGKHGDIVPLDAYSLASRLSFFLWNSGPDDFVLDAAASGDILSERGRAKVVNYMLDSPYLERGMRAFFDDWMEFNRFDSLAKDAMEYPMVSGVTLADAREQTLRTVIDHLLVKELDYRDLFTTRTTFVSRHLALIYGVPTKGEEWMEYEFPKDSPREGLLTHVSFLASHAHPARSSPTLRGKALREVFLCQHVPPAPPNVDFSKLNDAPPEATARERLDIHSTNPSCAGCHKIMDPMGLALENFDGAGLYRETQKGGSVIDTSGSLDGVAFKDIHGLNSALRNHPNLSSCLVSRLYSYGVGGMGSKREEKATLDFITDRFVKADYRLKAALKSIAMSTAFANVRSQNTVGTAGAATPSTAQNRS